MNYRVPQTGKTAFGYTIIPIREMLRNQRVCEYVQSSLLAQFEPLGLNESTVSNAVSKCIELAKKEMDLRTYECEAHTLLTNAGVLPSFIERTSGRAETMARLIQPHLCGGVTLDLGCGTGKVSEIIARFGHTVHLADVYKNPYIEESLPTLPFSYIKQDKPLPYDDAFFDDVLVLAMLHHANDPLSLLREIKRVLKVSGRLQLIETVFGIEDTPQNQSDSFSSLSEEEQRTVTMFLDYFANHVTWYFTNNMEHLVPVPFNFNTPNKWSEIFAAEHYKVVHQKQLGIDPNSGVYHMFYVLEKLES